MSSALTAATGVTCTRGNTQKHTRVLTNKTASDTQTGGYRYTSRASLASRDRLSQRMSNKTKRSHNKGKKRCNKSNKRHNKSNKR